MDPITAGIASGGVGLAGMYMQNQANSAQAQRMMDFQARMSGTAHQREVEDLRAAGLNPILSATNGGASSPTGAMADQGNMGDPISKGLDTAIAVRAQNKEFSQKDAQISNIKEDTNNKAMTSALIENQSAAAAKDVEQKTMQNRLLKETIPSAIKKAKAEGDYSEMNQIMGIIQSGASSAGSIINPFKGILNNLSLPKGK